MRLNLSLTLADLTAALHRLTPLELRLDDEGGKVLLFDPPLHVDLVPGVGLRARTNMRIRWPILGMAVTVRVESAVLLVLPSLVPIEGRDVLELSFRVEEADVRHLPAFIDERVVEKANQALAGDGARLRWRFLDALSFELPLPERMHAPGPTFDLRAESALLEITEHELLLAVTYASDLADAPRAADDVEEPNDAGPVQETGEPSATPESAQAAE